MTVHALYPFFTDKTGTAYRCKACGREEVILADNDSRFVTIQGCECDHILFERVEKVELYPEFAEFFAKKGWA